MVKRHLLMNLLTNATLAEIDAYSVNRIWPEGSCIFRGGDTCTGLHIVEEGLVKIYVANADGREQGIMIRRQGAALTLTPLLDGGKYATSARTLTAAKTRYLPRERFEELFTTHPDFRKAVLLEVGVALRCMVSLADSISLRRVPARVAARLLEQAELMGATNGQFFRMSLTQQELAHLVGSTRESVARALGQFRAAGLIEQHGPRVRILDPVALADWASGVEYTSADIALSA